MKKVLAVLISCLMLFIHADTVQADSRRLAGEAVEALEEVSKILNDYSEELANKKPYDFRGVKWNSRAQEYPGFKLVETDGIVSAYRRDQDRSFVGDIPLQSTPVYAFYNGRFMLAMMNVAPGTSKETVQVVLEKTFDKPNNLFPNYEISWHWRQSSLSPEVVLYYDKGTISMFNVALMKEWNRYAQTTQRDF